MRVRFKGSEATGQSGTKSDVFATSQDLRRVPAPIQQQLLRLVHLAAGMSTDEKAHARVAFASVGLGFALEGQDDAMAGAEMVSVLGVIVTLADAYARPEEANL